MGLVFNFMAVFNKCWLQSNGEAEHCGWSFRWATRGEFLCVKKWKILYSNTIEERKSFEADRNGEKHL